MEFNTSCMNSAPNNPKLLQQVTHHSVNIAVSTELIVQSPLQSTKVQTQGGDVLPAKADGMSSAELCISTTTISTYATLDTMSWG